MAELRWNAVLGEWVIVAADRQERTFLPPADACPLCPAPEPGASELERSDFDIAVFENRFPSLQREPPPPSIAGNRRDRVRPALGACEVVVYTARHDGSTGQLSQRRLEQLIEVWADRTTELGERPAIEYVLVFENHGAVAGVTLHHPHGQIYAYPFVPPVIRRELAAARRASGGCPWCRQAADERATRLRLVARSHGWLAHVPFAARWPYELTLLAERHVGLLSELDQREMAGLAALLRRVLRGYDGLFGFELPYVMVVHQRPTGHAAHAGYHLHLEFYPPNRRADRLKYLAGSELGAGTFINDVLPEEAAARLRRAAGR